MKKDFLEQRLCDRIEAEVMEVFYDYEDRYDEAYSNAISIYNELIEKNIVLNRNTYESFIIAMLDISNEIKKIETSEEVLKYAEKNIKSIDKIYRVKLAKAHLLALKSDYNNSIVIYMELEEHYKKIDDEVMLGVIEFHKGEYLNNTKCLIESLRIFINIFDNSQRSYERVQDTYRRLINGTLSIEELSEIKELENKLMCLGVAV